ncbi:MAG: O-methyltransferase [Fusobacteria bacterium]|nr:O-methyltransferase [Fusobacteriota bacterium]
MLPELEDANQYINSKISIIDNRILEMEKYAIENNIPIITREVAEYLKFMLNIHKSKNVLEIGTAIGYSGSIICESIKVNNGMLTTIEINKETYEISRNNFEKNNITNVKSYLGDAVDVLDNLNDSYDFIFIDASKGQYHMFFEKSFKLLEKDGIIFIDNILFRGYLYKENYPKRYKTIVNKLNKFIEYLYSNHNFVLLPFGDGIGLVKK